MEAILPFKIKNEHKFYESALKVGYNEMEIYKFIYVMQQSDLDIFPKMHDERINMLIYGWELCEDYKQKLNPDEWELPEEMEMMLKLMVPWSMDIWFSKEWDKCNYHLRTGLIHCLNRARDLLMRMPDMMQINWDFLLLYNLKPWNVLYLKNLTVTKAKTLENGAQSIEMEELPANSEDVAYVNLEQLPLIVLRLVKIFDQTSIDMVKTLCMRVLAAWNKIHQTELENSGSRRRYIPPEDKRCLLLICHIYLMAVYEADDVKGYVIDNMINNIRFYYQGFQNSTAIYAMDNLEYTPARFIALTQIHLRVQKRDFFDFFIWNKYDTSLVNLFGVVSQAYKSYLLGNLLMELNNMNEDDFASNIPLYKRLMNSYVNEREKSELFLLKELEKLEAQRYAHNIIQTVKNVSDFKSKICKGNRMSNIGNYENSDDTVAPLADMDTDNKLEIKQEVKETTVEGDEEEVTVIVKESELRLDPIFQNLPNNQSILYYVYEVLAKKDYKGWHFAKIVLLVKIIDHELNMIETWRYHPGLTTDFMLNLEMKMSQHYADLAKIFKDHAFIEQEFWLTAFYLNPTNDLYETIKRLGMRNNRKRADEQSKLVMSIDNIEAKYGLLSSTIDVKDIATLVNTDDPDIDYKPLYTALHSLRLPDSLVKDMITAIFLPRNKSFAWVVDWGVLRARCKMIMTSKKEKKRFVELNMAEANDRLKYLIIDYEKYKNRPQLDYGTIEEGYENLMTSGDFDKETDEEEEEEEEEDDFEDDEDVYEGKRKGRGSFGTSPRKKEETKVEDDNSQEDDPFLMGKRRTRARTAATLASFLFQTLPRSSRRKRNQNEEKPNAHDHDDKSSDSKSPITTSESPMPPSSPLNSRGDGDLGEIEVQVPTKNLKECLSERPAFLNLTQGFQNLIDIWNVETSDLQTIDENCFSLLESSSVLQRAVKWKLLNKELNPMGCDEHEYIDETDMVIHNSDFAMKMEGNLSAVNREPVSEAIMGKEMALTTVEEGGEGEKVINKNTTEELNAESVYSFPLEREESIKEKVSLPEPESSETWTNLQPPPVEMEDENSREETNNEINSKRNSISKDIDMETDNNTEDENDAIKRKTPKQKESEETEPQESIEQQLENEDKIVQENEKEEHNDNVEDKNDKDNSGNEQQEEEKFMENEIDKQSVKDKGEDIGKPLNEADTSTGEESKTQEQTENLLDEVVTKAPEELSNSQPEKLSTGAQESKERKELNTQTESIKDLEIAKNTTAGDRAILPIKTDTEQSTKIDSSQELENLNEAEKNAKNKIENKHEQTVTHKEYPEENVDRKISGEKETELDKSIEGLKLKHDEEQLTETEDKDKEFLQIESNIILHYSSADEMDVTEKLQTTKITPRTRTPSPTSAAENERRDSTDSETRNLKEICLTRKLEVMVYKLRPSDLVNLRQPRVKIQRMSYEKNSHQFRAKRRRLSERIILDIDDSSNSNHSYGNNSSSSDTYHPPRSKRRVPARRLSLHHMQTSESDNDSMNSDDVKLSTIVTKAKIRERRVSTPSSSHSSSATADAAVTSKTRFKPTRYAAGPKSAKQNLVVTPRSASGLKLRISHAEETSERTRKNSTSIMYDDDVIQLSSSSSDACLLSDLTTIEEELIEVDDQDHPLFEEEIII